MNIAIIVQIEAAKKIIQNFYLPIEIGKKEVSKKKSVGYLVFWNRRRDFV